jgi:hypothetical protein
MADTYLPTVALRKVFDGDAGLAGMVVNEIFSVSGKVRDSEGVLLCSRS